MIGKNRIGFTLLEIVLVVVILGIIIGITVPNFSQTFKKYQLKTTVDDLSYLMRYAQSRAVMKNAQIRLEFDEEFKKYWLTQADVGEEGREQDFEFTRIKGRMGRRYEVPMETTIESEESTIHFFPDGTIDKIYIYVTDEDHTFTISTKEQRGYVRVFEEKL